jgi:type II secretory pathway pseudopilin PulG
MKLFYKPTRKRIIIVLVLGVIVGLGTYAYQRSEEQAANTPAAVAEQQDIAKALSGEPVAVPSKPPAMVPVTAQPEAMPADDPSVAATLQKAGAADPDGGAINQDAFPYATTSGAKSRDGYPIYLIECNGGSHQCVGETGQPIGGATEVADKLPPVRNTDAARYSCPDSICIDPQGNVVGSVAPVMRLYLAKTRQARP